MSDLCKQANCSSPRLPHDLARELAKAYGLRLGRDPETGERTVEPLAGLCEFHALRAIQAADRAAARQVAGGIRPDEAPEAPASQDGRPEELVSRGDDGLLDLSRLLVLHEMAERPLLDPVDLRIARVAVDLGRVSWAEIARRIGITPPAVLKRVRRLRAELAADRKPPREPLADPAAWRALKGAARALGALHDGATLSDETAAAAEEYRDAVALYRRLIRVRFPDRDPAGQRIPQPQCRYCGRFLARPTTTKGRPPKWCDDKCRGRGRRRRKGVETR